PLPRTMTSSRVSLGCSDSATVIGTSPSSCFELPSATGAVTSVAIASGAGVLSASIRVGSFSPLASSVVAHPPQSSDICRNTASATRRRAGVFMVRMVPTGGAAYRYGYQKIHLGTRAASGRRRLHFQEGLAG